jgi:hypothetical protein
MKRRHRAAIDTRAAANDQCLRLAPAFGEARKIEEFVEPQTPLRLRLRRKQIGLAQRINRFQTIRAFIMPECPAIAAWRALYGGTEFVD